MCVLGLPRVLIADDDVVGAIAVNVHSIRTVGMIRSSIDALDFFASV